MIMRQNNLAKFHHFDATIYNFGHFEKVHLLLDKNFSLLRQIWAKVQCCEWPNIEPIHQPSGHTADKTVHKLLQSFHASILEVALVDFTLKTTWHYSSLVQICKDKYSYNTCIRALKSYSNLWSCQLRQKSFTLLLPGKLWLLLSQSFCTVAFWAERGLILWRQRLFSEKNIEESFGSFKAVCT